MNLYKFHDKSESLKGANEKDLLVPELIYQKAKEYSITAKEEKKLATSPKFSYYYALNCLGRPFIAGENAIAKDAVYAYKYAVLIGKRFEKGESEIAKDADTAFYYAKRILKRRWPEAEPNILHYPIIAYKYAMEVISDRWPEFEKEIMKSEKYRKKLGEDYIKHYNTAFHTNL